MREQGNGAENAQYAPFTVVAGKIESDGERNYKYIESFSDVMDAVAALNKVQDYHFAEIEYRAGPSQSAGEGLSSERIGEIAATYFHQDGTELADVKTALRVALREASRGAPAALVAAPAIPVELRGIAEAIKEGNARGKGSWVTCTGCYDTEDGRPTQKYAHSDVFGCDLGCGCQECGGIGAVWDDTDYAEMAEFMARDDAAPALASPAALTVLREAMAWGRSFGATLVDPAWSEMRDAMAEQFMQRLPLLPAAYPRAEAQPEDLPKSHGGNLDEETAKAILAFVNRPGDTYNGYVRRQLGLGFALALKRAIDRAAPRAEAQAVPEGYVLVPLEPTEKMVEHAIYQRADLSDFRQGMKPAPFAETRAQYRAMLAAAEAPKEGNGNE